MTDGDAEAVAPGLEQQGHVPHVIKSADFKVGLLPEQVLVGAVAVDSGSVVPSRRDVQPGAGRSAGGVYK